MKFLKRLFKDEEGQGLAEYGLILALVAVVVITGLTTLGTEINNLLKYIENRLAAVS